MGLTSATITRLKSQLITSGLNQRNQALFQVIDELIDALRQLQQDVFGTSTGSGGSGPSGISNATFITAANETALLPNSRQLVAGDNITIDNGTPGQTIISAEITQTTIIQTNQPVVIGTAQIEISPNRKNGKVYLRSKFTESQIGGPVFITQVPDRDSDMAFIIFIGQIIDEQRMKVFWQAPFGAPRRVTINYLIGA